MELTKTESNLNKKEEQSCIVCLLFLLMFHCISKVNMCKEAFPCPHALSFLNFSTDSFHVPQEFSQTAQLCVLFPTRSLIPRASGLMSGKVTVIINWETLLFAQSKVDENEWKSFRQRYIGLR